MADPKTSGPDPLTLMRLVWAATEAGNRETALERLERFERSLPSVVVAKLRRDIDLYCPEPPDSGSRDRE